MKVNFSYTNLLEEFSQKFSSELSKQQLKNFRSTVNSWCKVLRLNKSADVGDEFTDQFRHYLSVYGEALYREGIRTSTKASRRSIIKKLRVFFLQRIDELFVPASFDETLSHFIKLRGYSVPEFRNKFLKDDISLENFRNWVKGGALPQQKRRPLIEKIETLLAIPRGVLLLKLGWRAKTDMTVSTKYGARISVTRKKPYRVEMPSFEGEFNDLVKFKSLSVLPEGMERRRNALWTSSEGAVLPSAAKAKTDLTFFLGFCHLSESSADPMLRGLGISNDKLTLGLIADKSAVEKYLLEFKLARGSGKFNYSYLNFISLVTSLLRENTGYLYQNPSFASKLGLELTVQQWQAKCLETRNRLLKIKSAIEELRSRGSGEFEMGRDPEEPIANILALSQPLTATMAMTMAMIADISKMNARPIHQACLYRDALLLTLLQANPLRIKMFRIMKFDENLIKEADGSWWIKFNRNAFKNRHSLSSDYKVQVASDVWDMIDIYQAKFRSLFPSSHTSRHVFLSSKDPLNDQKRDFNLPLNLGKIVFNRTKKYINDSPGFGPHALRHIVCSSIIKANPEFGFFLAARVLHDKLETVEKYYAHLKTSDLIEPYNHQFSGLWKSVNNNSSASSGGSAVAKKAGGEII